MGLKEDLGFSKPIEERTHEAVLNVVVTGEMLRKEATRVLRRFGLTGAQYNVLSLLRHQSPDGSVNQTRLGRMLVGTVDFVYFDRMNYRWKVEGIYRKYGLQDFLNPNYFHRVQSTIVTIIKNQGVEYQVRG